MKATGKLPYVIAGVKGLQLGVSARYVQEIVRTPRWHAVPNTCNGQAQGFEASGTSTFLHEAELPGDRGAVDGDQGEGNHADHDEPTGLF